ncbi:MAG: site-2 protease family protein [Clostridium sp.]|uniref:site-2 protease family protein n=1 Tax=Clostridium sp. TaxID=1506 RepID=UPI003F2F5731
MADKLLGIIYSVPAILLAFTFHSYAKGWMATKLGDPTPKLRGRMNLNPLTHIDPIGTLLILVCGIGWAKPMDIDTRYFKNFYKDDLKVSLAGPLANLMVAIVGAIIYAIFSVVILKMNMVGNITIIISIMLKFIITINVNLFIFYLLPLPGLDGFNIFRDLSPKNFYKYGEPLIQHQFLILIGIILLAGPIISIPSHLILTGLQGLINLIISIFIF